MTTSDQQNTNSKRLNLTYQTVGAPDLRTLSIIAMAFLSSPGRRRSVSANSLISIFAVTLAIFAIISTLSIRAGFRADLVGAIVGHNPHIKIVPNDTTSKLCFAGVLRPEHNLPLASISRVTSYQALTKGRYGEILLEVIHIDGPLPAGTEIETPVKELALGDILLSIGLSDRLDLGAGDQLQLLRPVPSGNGTQTIDRFQLKISHIYSHDSNLGNLSRIFVVDTISEIEDNYEYWILLENPEIAPEVKAKLEDLCGDRVNILTWQDQETSMLRSLDIEDAVMSIIVALIVIASGLAVFSGYFLMVRTKLPAIAVLKTIGFSNFEIVMIFFLGALVIWLPSFFLGSGISYVFLVNVDSLLGLLDSIQGNVTPSYSLPTDIRFSHFMRAFAISGVTVVLAIFPALAVALRLSPIQTLHRSN